MSPDSERRSNSFERLLREMVGGPISPEEDARRAKAELDRMDREESLRRSQNWDALRRDLGRRYEDCSLENFVATTDRQRKVLKAVTAYSDDLRERVKAGANLVLFGPKGTGKDHLVAALLHRAVLNHGLTAAWINGMDMFGRMRDRMDENASEAALVAQFAKPAILAISDPVPPSGALNDWQLSQFCRVVDRRYRDLRPTWITINTATPAEAEQRMGAQIVDRLRHGALVLHCDWPTCRQPKGA